MNKRKVKFIIERQFEKMEVMNPVKIFRDFDYSELIATGIVTREKDLWICEAELPEDCLNLTPSIGYQIIKWEVTSKGERVIKEARLLTIGLSEYKNEDPEIKQINQNNLSMG